MTAAAIRDFVDASPDPTLALDSAGQILVVNGQADTLFGYARGGLLGQSTRTILPGLDVAALETSRRGIRLEVLGQRQDGGAFPASVSLTPVAARRVIAIVLDLSVQKRAEEGTQLLASERAARMEAERVNVMKDHFLATLSHELRTPLNAMLGWTQLLGSHGASEEIAARAVETIERNIRLQTRLIDDLLDMSRVVSGKLSLDVRPVQLAPLIASVLEFFSPKANDKGIALRNDLQAEMPTVSGDPDRLEQVVWNLVSNAVKFTPQGGSVDVSLRQAGSFVRIEVADTGEGIDGAFLPRVFDRFRQADSSMSRRHEGLGLGLSIVKGLVDLHGGTVHAASAGRGQGATFVVEIPVAGPGVPPLGEAAAEESWSRAAKGEKQGVQGLRVLVVDDSADSRDFVSRVLESLGATVVAAASASEALASLSSDRPDVMLCDIGMPGEDGFHFIRRVRALDRGEGGAIPAAALTAYTGHQDRKRALQAGFQIHVSKPADPRQLAAVVQFLAAQVQRPS